MKNTEKTMDKIVALCKNRGFVFPGSEIYGGLANTWDYGPLGAELKKNIKNAWWKKFVQENPYNVGLDAAILMNPQTWVASGHLSGFSDPLMDCRECHERFRADKLIEDWCAENGFELSKPIDAFSQSEMKDFVEEHNIPCPTCGKHNFTDIRQFNLMFKTFQGVTEDAKNTVYLRPETAQGIFVNFNNVQRTTRKKLPFGIGQIGKSFRNEITPGNFIFRVREFEQMELEFFCKPGTDLEWFQYWRTFCHNWLLSIGLKDENLRLRDHDPEELCFYSKATTDFEFLFPFGWGELWGVADRTDYDLTQHSNTSGEKLVYREGEGKDMVEYIPYVIEPSLGVERSVLAVLCDAYDEEVVGQDKNGKDDVRVVLHFHPALAVQGRDPAAEQERSSHRPRTGAVCRAEQGVHGRLRRDRLHRQALSPRGRDWHAVLHHVRLRHRRRRGQRHRGRPLRDRARARHDAAGAYAHQRGQGVSAREVRVLR